MVVNKFTKEQLLKQANTMYPIGTKYIDAGIPKNEVILTVRDPFSVYSKDHDYYITDGCGGAVYEDGRWAEIDYTIELEKIREIIYKD